MKKHFLCAVALTVALCTLPLFGCSESGKGQGDVNLDDTQIVQPEKPESDEFGTGKVSLAKYSLTEAGRAEEKIISEVFSEAGKNNGKYRLVFAAAVKGDVGAVTIERKAITGTSAEEKTKTCENFYEGIRRGDKIYYYDSATQSMTTDSSKKGEFYWAVYTVEFASDSYYEKDITVDFKPANLDETKTATQNLKAEALSSIELEMVGKEDEEINLYTGVELDLQIQAWQFGQTVTPTVTDSADENSITDGKFSSTVTGAHTITVRYEDPDISDFFVQQTRTINVGRKIFKANSISDVTIDNEYGNYLNQTVKYTKNQESKDSELNISADTYYYAEGEFVATTAGDTYLGFAHYKTDGNGDRLQDTTHLLTTFKANGDRSLVCADTASSINSNRVNKDNLAETQGIKFANRAENNISIAEGGKVKIATLRYGNTVYNFIDDQYAGAYNLTGEYENATILGLYVNMYGADGKRTQVEKLDYFVGEQQVSQKLNSLMQSNYICEYDGEFVLEFDYKYNGKNANAGTDTQILRLVVKSADAGIDATSHLEFGAKYHERKFIMNFEEYAARSGGFATSKNFVTEVTEQGIAGTKVNDNGYNPICEPYFTDYNPGSVVYSEPAANTEKQFMYQEKTAHYKLTRRLVGEEGAKKNEYTMEVSFENAAGVMQTFSRKIVLSNTPTGINFGTGAGKVIVQIQQIGDFDATVSNLNWNVQG